MAYRFLSSRIYYQTSKYAPVAVVCLRLGTPDDAVQEIKSSVVITALQQISKRSASGQILISGDGAPLEIYGDLVLVLQRHAGHDVAYFRVEDCDADGQYYVFIEYEDHATAFYAADVALDIFNALCETPGGLTPAAISTLQEQLDEYLSFAMARRVDPNTRLLKEAAGQQGIPVISKDLIWGSPTWPGAAVRTGIVQYGWGINQRHCQGGLPLGSLTSRQIEDCKDRAFVVKKLADTNLPIARQDLEFVNRNQVRRAQRSAGRIGYPVVVRPRVTALPQYGYLDKGIFGPLENDEQIALVVSYLRGRAGADIWVESFLPGAHYRFLILGNEVVSVLRMVPPTVTGDGIRTVADLAQTSVESSVDPESYRVWRQLATGDDAQRCRLQLGRMSLSSIPAIGEHIALRDEGTCYNGGLGTEVLEEVPAHFSTMTLQAAAVFGFQQMVGIDLIIAELQGPAEMPNCAVTGIDPIPDLVAHGKASEMNYRRVAEKYFSMLLPRGRDFRIPAVSVTGTNGKTTTSRMIAGILKESGLKVGLSCSDGSYVDDEILIQGDESGVLGANEVLSNSSTEAAVLETARGNMANTGIAFQQIDVGACLNVTEDHLGYQGIETLDQMAVHKRQVIERSTRAVVLNAEDARCVAMREHSKARDVVLFAYDPEHPEIVSHIRNNGCVVVIENIDNRPTIVLRTPGLMTEPVIAVADIPATGDGTALHNIYNALAAVGIAQCLGVSVEHMAGGLQKFVMGINTTPGRLNEIPGFPFDVLVDAAHNPLGFRSLISYVNHRKVIGKKILVIGIRKFFSHDTIQRCTAEIAGNFDLYILRYYRPGDNSEPENSMALESLKDGLLRYGAAESEIIVETDVLASLDRGIECSVEGDLLVVQLPASGNDKWQLIDHIKASKHRANADILNTMPLSESGSGDKDIRLLLCGDVMLGRGIDQVLPSPGDSTLYEKWRNIHDARHFVTLAQQKNGNIDKERNLAYVWGDVLSEAEAFRPDLRLVNLETAVTALGRAWPEKLVHFRMNPQNIDVLNVAQIDCCALANNHVMDWGRTGLEETVQTLDRAGIRYAGAGLGKHDAEEPAVLQVPGKGRVIVLSMATASSGIPATWAADEERSGINLVELNQTWVKRISHLAESIKQPGDILVVSIHWGGNYEPVVPQNQREFARQLIDNAGVDIIHGHSSHHVRGIELHNGKLILYGCGDLINDYEGIDKLPERQLLSPDLGLMYFARISPENGRLISLQMVPMTMRQLRVTRGGKGDTERLKQVLNQECPELGTIVVSEGDVLHLKILSNGR